MPARADRTVPVPPSLSTGGLARADRHPGWDGAPADEEHYEGIEFPPGSFAGSDGRHAEFVDCLLAPGDADGVRLAGARLQGCRWTAPRAAAFDARGARLDNCQIDEPRFGAADLHGAVLDRVAVGGGKIDYLNLRGARLADVQITGTVIGELDMTDSSVRRLRLADVRLGRISVRHAALRFVDLRGAELAEVDSLPDLRGATINDRQLYDLAPALAAHLGIEVVPG